MSKEDYHICCNIDDNYAQHCGVMLSSLFSKNSKYQFVIHILISELSEFNKLSLKNLIQNNGSICRFHKIKSEVFKGVQVAKYRSLTESTYYRLVIASALDSSISKALYLDSDILIWDEIVSLFDLELDGYALAATKDLIKMNDEYRLALSLPQMEPYFNAGIMLINLEYWRKNNAEKQLVDFAMNNKKVINHDQDALNAVFHGKWYMLSPKWNRFYPYIYDKSYFENKNDKAEFEKSPVIIHFVNRFKPWNNLHWFGSRWSRYRKRYYSYLKNSSWKECKPINLSTEIKFGLYRYLIKLGFRQTFLDVFQFFSYIVKKSEKIIFLPLNLFFKLEHIVGKDRDL